MANHAHRLIDIHEIELVRPQKSRRHLENIGIRKILPYTSPFTHREWDDELLEILGSGVVESVWVVCGMIIAPDVRVVMESMNVKEDLGLEESQHTPGL